MPITLCLVVTKWLYSHVWPPPLPRYQVCSGQAWATADVLYAVQAEELEKRLGYAPTPNPTLTLSTLPLTRTLVLHPSYP